MTTFLPAPVPSELIAKVHAAYGLTSLGDGGSGGNLADLARQRLEALDPASTLDMVLRRLFDPAEHTVSAFGSSL